MKEDVVEWMESISVPDKIIATLTNGRDGVLRNGPFLLNATSSEVTEAFGSKVADSLDVRVLLQRLHVLQNRTSAKRARRDQN